MLSTNPWASFDKNPWARFNKAVDDAYQGLWVREAYDGGTLRRYVRGDGPLGATQVGLVRFRYSTHSLTLDGTLIVLGSLLDAGEELPEYVVFNGGVLYGVEYSPGALEQAIQAIGL